MRDGAYFPSVRLLDLTMDWGIQATHNLSEGGKKGSMVDRGRPVEKNARRERKLSGPRKD
jgi:hypothetical protein